MLSRPRSGWRLRGPTPLPQDGVLRLGRALGEVELIASMGFAGGTGSFKNGKKQNKWVKRQTQTKIMGDFA